MRRSSRRKWSDPHVPLDGKAVLRGNAKSESGRNGARWLVRPVGGSDKAYRCPGCNQEIAPGTSHLVVWPEDHLFGDEAGLADRRHWHTRCWRSGPSR